MNYLKKIFYEYGNGNKFVHISFENNHSKVQVNEKFKIIILVDEKKIK